MASSLNTNLLPKFHSVKVDGEEITCTHQKSALESFFAPYRRNVIGNRQVFESPFGKKEIVYADWTATGRAYQPIEEYIQKEIMPFLANTHTETTITGTLMSKAYEESKIIVKKHVNANSDDVLVFCGSGMTSAVNKLQRILGMRIPERVMDYVKKDCPEDMKELKDRMINNVFSGYMHLDEVLRPIVLLPKWSTTATILPGWKQLPQLK